MERSKRAPANQVARILYLLSLLLLLAGAGLMINPHGRRTGEIVQVFITLAAFELYAWALLGLLCWHTRRGGAAT